MKFRYSTQCFNEVLTHVVPIVAFISIFPSNLFFLYPLKTSENQRIFDVFRRYKKSKILESIEMSKHNLWVKRPFDVSRDNLSMVVGPRKMFKWLHLVIGFIEWVPLIISYQLYFFRISKIWSMLHHGSAARVQSKECYFMLTYIFLAFFCCFS